MAHPVIGGAPLATFQSRVAPWMRDTFGPEISADKVERNDRFIEEALELVQAGGMTRDRVLALVDYTYGRPTGHLPQEVGGVMVTLAALCLAQGVDMHAEGETELARISTPEMMKKIRAKQASKPRGSALPVAVEPTLRSAVLRTLQAAVDDPMWPNHVELRKSTLRAAISAIKTVDEDGERFRFMLAACVPGSAECAAMDRATLEVAPDDTRAQTEILVETLDRARQIVKENNHG